MSDTTSASAFQNRAFMRYFPSRVFHHFAMQIMVIAVTWQVWEVTRSTEALGWIGLTVFLPVLLLVVPAGIAADHYDRLRILFFCMALEALAALGLLAFSAFDGVHIGLVYACLVLIGVASAFGNPAAQSLVPNILTDKQLAHGISLNTMTWQIASVAGPALGGVLLLLGAKVTYATAFGLLVLATAAVAAIGQVNQTHHENPDTGFAAVAGGFDFVWSEPIVLGAISLDMFAVLLGGAVALMPVYATDVLHAGSVENGLMRAAPGIGAVLVGLFLAKFGIKDRAGWWMFVAVAFTGAVIVVFGWSVTAWLSILMLFLYGAFDMVSVYIREILMQLWTPDKVRGRVNAVNNVFIGASNQLGETRAGFMASAIGPGAIGAVPTVIIGGFATVAVAALWAFMFPKLRDQRYLTKPD